MPIYKLSVNVRQMSRVCGMPPGEYIAHLVTCDVTSYQVTTVPSRCRHCTINIFLFRLWGQNVTDRICES